MTEPPPDTEAIGAGLPHPPGSGLPFRPPVRGFRTSKPARVSWGRSPTLPHEDRLHERETIPAHPPAPRAHHGRPRILRRHRRSGLPLTPTSPLTTSAPCGKQRTACPPSSPCPP